MTATHALYIKEEKIGEFLSFLGPFESVSVMCLPNTNDDGTHYRVDGLSKEFCIMIYRDHSNLMIELPTV